MPSPRERPSEPHEVTLAQQGAAQAAPSSATPVGVRFLRGGGFDDEGLAGTAQEASQ
ncbi:hypothetical protein [Streptomyces sp. NPDC006307]|uniref:hypothetical protein n=1 Tax=Streptomyces sp. NPDC006307 TaxID=3156748 RepID=UPI0033A9117F